MKTGKERGGGGGLCSSKRAELGGHNSAECQSDLRLHPLMTRRSQLLPDKMLWFSTSWDGMTFKGTVEKIWLPGDLHPSRVNWDRRDVPWKTSEDSAVISLQIHSTPMSDSILGADKMSQQKLKTPSLRLSSRGERERERERDEEFTLPWILRGVTWTGEQRDG